MAYQPKISDVLSGSTYRLYCARVSDCVVPITAEVRIATTKNREKDVENTKIPIIPSHITMQVAKVRNIPIFATNFDIKYVFGNAST
jgi:hypothetical protein